MMGCIYGVSSHVECPTSHWLTVKASVTEQQQPQCVWGSSVTALLQSSSFPPVLLSCAWTSGKTVRPGLNVLNKEIKKVAVFYLHAGEWPSSNFKRIRKGQNQHKWELKKCTISPPSGKIRNCTDLNHIDPVPTSGQLPFII